MKKKKWFGCGVRKKCSPDLVSISLLMSVWDQQHETARAFKDSQSWSQSFLPSSCSKRLVCSKGSKRPPPKSLLFAHIFEFWLEKKKNLSWFSRWNHQETLSLFQMRRVWNVLLFFFHLVWYAAFEIWSPLLFLPLIRTINSLVCECTGSLPSALKHSSGNVIYWLLSPSGRIFSNVDI